MRDASTAPRAAEGGGGGVHAAGTTGGVFAAWRRAVTPGLVLVAVLTGAVVASGRLPDGVAPWVMAGAGGATVTALFGVWIKCRAVMSPPDSGGQAGAALNIALIGDFALQLFVVGIALIALFLADVQFPFLAGLALAFAGVVLVFQLSSAMSLARSLRSRSLVRSTTTS